MKIKKDQKPIDFDIHLKYICKKCGQFHWLSFKETSTKNFKIVCDCNHIFSVRRTSKFLLKYKLNNKIANIKKNIISKEILDKATPIFTRYGFTKEESQKFLSEMYEKNPIKDIVLLVKETLKLIREKNDNSDASI